MAKLMSPNAATFDASSASVGNRVADRCSVRIAVADRCSFRIAVAAEASFSAFVFHLCHSVVMVK